MILTIPLRRLPHALRNMPAPGPGASTADRVDWSRELTTDENKAYTLDAIFQLTITFNALIEAPAPTPWYGDY